MSQREELLGRRVFNRWQPHKRGVIIEVESGCNGGIRVRFDNQDYGGYTVPGSLMVTADLAFEDTGKVVTKDS